MSSKYTLLVFLLLGLAVPSVSQSLTAYHVQDLNFGNQIFPGTEKRIDPKDANAASFVISGDVGKQVQIQFHLPEYLSDSEGNNLSIYFTSSGAAYSIDETGKTTANIFDPKAGTVTTLNTNGKLYVWLGGVIQPLSNQPGTAYTSDIVLDVSYAN